MVRHKSQKLASLLFVMLFFVLSCFGCTKNDLKGQMQKVIGDTGKSEGEFEFGGEVTDVLPNDQNAHFFTEKVFVESEATGIVAYTINRMTILTNLDSKTFPVSDFSQRAKENGWISNESVLNSDYDFILVDLSLEKVKDGIVKNEATLVNTLRLVYKNESGEILPAGDMEYFSFEETDSAKHSENPNEYLGVYLSEGASIDCSVGYFMPKGTVTNTKDLFFALGVNPEKTQYIYPK